MSSDLIVFLIATIFIVLIANQYKKSFDPKPIDDVKNDQEPCTLILEKETTKSFETNQVSLIQKIFLCVLLAISLYGLAVYSYYWLYIMWPCLLVALIRK